MCMVKTFSKQVFICRNLTSGCFILQELSRKNNSAPFISEYVPEIKAFILLHFDCGYSIIIPVTGLGGKKSKPENDSFLYVGGRPCAIGTREPCQAGNRAALSGMPDAMQSVCRSHI